MAKSTKPKSEHARIKSELEKHLGEPLEGIRIAVEHSSRWDRTCFTFRWNGFADMLLEERFRLLVKHLPEKFLDKHGGQAVWLELTEDEEVDEFLRQPRSEDMDGRLEAIWRELSQANFFAVLEDELVRVGVRQAADDLSVSKRVMRARGAAEEQVRDTCLAFIREGAYTDWEVLSAIRPLAERSAGKSGASRRKGK